MVRFASAGAKRTFHIVLQNETYISIFHYRHWADTLFLYAADRGRPFYR